ncbi:hypothetical protein L7F22_005219 [Adiantum nelumboides]|nr:hypothetical protein [Adiantum nelumboides]
MGKKRGKPMPKRTKMACRANNLMPTSLTMKVTSTKHGNNKVKQTRTSNLRNYPPLALQAKPTFPKPKPPPLTTPVQPVLQVVDNSPKPPKKRTQLTWTEEDMAKTLKARENGLSLYKCSLQFGISKATITNWEEGRTQKKKKGLATVLTMQEEDALLKWIFLKCDSGHGVLVIDLKLKVAEICQTRHTLFSNGILRKSWWEGFRKRQPKLGFRVSKSLDQSRASRFRPEIIKTLYENLQKLYVEHNYPPSNIWNANETGFQGLRDKGMKAKKVDTCLSLMAMIVSLEVVAKAHALGIDIITLPTHTSHKLQPLDVLVLKSLKVQFQMERDIWQQRATSRQASKSELVSIVAKDITSSYTEANIKVGFQATGIWPLNPSALKFEGMPCNHINIVEETTSINDEDIFQVPTTPVNAPIEDEAVHVLNSMAAQQQEEEPFSSQQNGTIHGITFHRPYGSR